LSEEKLSYLLKFASSIEIDEVDDSKVDLLGLEESFKQAILIQKGELPRRTTGNSLLKNLDCPINIVFL
jgi:hypothetical protein